MFFGTIRKTYRERNFEFLPSRSDIDLSRSNIEIAIRLPVITIFICYVGMDKVNDPFDPKVRVKVTKVIAID